MAIITLHGTELFACSANEKKKINRLWQIIVFYLSISMWQIFECCITGASFANLKNGRGASSLGNGMYLEDRKSKVFLKLCRYDGHRVALPEF